MIGNSSYVPDIILADYRLPGDQDGIEIATALQLAVGKAVPAISITGESEMKEIREISDLGYTILRKPVRPTKLRSLLNFHVTN